MQSSDFSTFVTGHEYVKNTTEGELTIYYNATAMGLSIYVDGINKGFIKL